LRDRIIDEKQWQFTDNLKSRKGLEACLVLIDLINIDAENFDDADGQNAHPL